MAVVAGKRNDTKFDFYDQAMHLRCNMTKFLMCNFGTSKTYKDIRAYAVHHKMTDEDKEMLEEIFDRYGKDLRIETSFPFWTLEEERKTIIDILRSLTSHIVAANTIYPNSIDLYNIKQKNINLAIVDCQALLTEFEFIAIMFNSPNMDLSCFNPYLDEINILINKLRKFRTRTNGQKTFAYQEDLETKNKASYYIGNNILVTNSDGTIKSCDQYKKEVANFNKEQEEITKVNKIIANCNTNYSDNPLIEDINLSNIPDIDPDKIVHPTFNSNIILEEPKIIIPDAIADNSYVQQMIHNGSHWYMSDVNISNGIKTFTNRNYTYDKYNENGQPIYPAVIFDAVKFS